jgi:putative transposase
MLNFKGMRFPVDVILECIRWYAAYPLSYRHLEEMMEDHGVSVDHSSINRWAIRFLPLIEKMARKHKRPVGGSWRMDETYINVKAVWKYLYRPSTSRARPSTSCWRRSRTWLRRSASSTRP